MKASEVRLDVNEVKETAYLDKVNQLLRDGWVILCISPGKEEDGGAYFLYSLGKEK